MIEIWLQIKLLLIAKGTIEHDKLLVSLYSRRAFFSRRGLKKNHERNLFELLDKIQLRRNKDDFSQIVNVFIEYVNKLNQRIEKRLDKIDQSNASKSLERSDLPQKMPVELRAFMEKNKDYLTKHQLYFK